MPCKLSHRASAQAPEREGICCETGNAVIWSSVIYHATERCYKLSEVLQGCGVQVSTLLHHTAFLPTSTLWNVSLFPHVSTLHQFQGGSYTGRCARPLTPSSSAHAVFWRGTSGEVTPLQWPWTPIRLWQYTWGRAALDLTEQESWERSPFQQWSDWHLVITKPCPQTDWWRGWMDLTVLWHKAVSLLLPPLFPFTVSGMLGSHSACYLTSLCFCSEPLWVYVTKVNGFSGKKCPNHHQANGRSTEEGGREVGMVSSPISWWALW